jgi:hypothetical protein
MNGFVEECLQEWRRLGVPDPVANEMAMDLAVDITEAEAEGGSAEDVLGNSAFDPPGFAASWAFARGVSGPPAPDAPASHGPLAIALTVVAALITLAAAALVAARHGASVAVAFPARGILGGPSSGQFLKPGPASPPLHIVVPGSAFVVNHIAGVNVLPVIVFLVGVAGLVLAGVYWSVWLRRRYRRRIG